MDKEAVKKILKELSGRDKEILRIVTNALYFDDNSDFRTALWEVVREIVGEGVIEDCNSEIYNLLNF